MRRLDLPAKLVFLTGALGCVVSLAGCRRQDLSGSSFITMGDNTFSPREMRIPVGGHVHFRNWGGTVHNAVALDTSWSTMKVSGSEAMRPGEWVDIEFDTAGVYRFYCKFHGTPDGKLGMVGMVLVGDVAAPVDSASKSHLAAVEYPTGVTRRVPEEYPSVQAGVDAAAPGDLVLIGEGTYKEEVIVTTPSVTIRGVDRNKVILHGENTRANGITVYANGVAIENLTARNYTLNGFFITGVTGYRGSYISAINNGDYGVYAFDSYNGVLDHSLGSGSPDAGFYVGGCYPCKTILDQVAGINNIGGGYSGTNSGGDTYIINSLWSNNGGGGVDPNTFDVEPHAPQRETTIIGNVITNNGGAGVGIAGGNRNLVERNYIAGNRGSGISIYAARDRNYYPSSDNIVRDNIIIESGRADISMSGVGNLGNCFANNVHRATIPWGLSMLQRCGRFRLPVVGDPGAYFRSVAGRNWLFSPNRTFGTEWKTWPDPEPGESMPGGAGAPVRPAVRPFEAYPIDLASIRRPDPPATTLAAKAGDR
jgi:plastocyanin